MRERLSRAALIEIAADLADEIGLDQLSITRVSRAAGISTPGVYKHVADLTDLRRGIAMQTCREVTALVQSAGAGRSGADALASVALALLDWANRHPGRYAAVQTVVAPEDREYEELSRQLIEAIAASLRAYDLSADARVDAVRTLRGLLHGFVMLQLSGGFGLERGVAASFERAARSLDAVFRSWGGS